MEKCNDTFISSTAWTERVGFAAGLATIKFLRKKKVFLRIKKRGKYILKKWKELADLNGLRIKTNEFYSNPSFQFEYGKKNEELHTLFTELMLKKGYLATNNMFITYSHKLSDIQNYLKKCNECFYLIKQSIDLKKKLLKSRIRKITY